MCSVQSRSSVGGSVLLIFNCKVGCRPVGFRKEEENEVVEGWCRAGKEKSVGLGFVSSPTTVRKPPRESSSGSFGDSTERIPTSRRSLGEVVERDKGPVVEGQKAESVRAWDMVSKSIFTAEASRRDDTRARQFGSEFRQSLCLV